MNKYFIITVDTEGDNQWCIYNGEPITTNNAKCLPYFQRLCDEFNFKPVYFVNYEMICDDYLTCFLKKQIEYDRCEVGMHLHAWNSPPLYSLEKRYRGNPYITEYPDDIIYQKMQRMTSLIENRVGVRPVSHRAGRWASSKVMFDILEDLKYSVDCSIVSGCDMSNYPGSTVKKGADYRKEPEHPYMINNTVLEVPMSVKRIRTIEGKSVKNRIKNIIVGKDIWLRPALCSVREMKNHIDVKMNQGFDYVEFMIHSSELMPSGSPYYKSESDIEKEYKAIKEIFEYADSKGFKGITLKEYRREHSL